MYENRRNKAEQPSKFSGFLANKATNWRIFEIKHVDDYLYCMRITQKLTFVIVLLFISFQVKAQQTVPVRDTAVLKDTVYSQNDVDVKAEYPGGDQARIDFIEQKVNGSVATDNGAPKGTYTVVVICIIDTNGKIIAAVQDTHHGYGMEKEVLRIINKLPKPYKPAMKNGVPVKSKIKFPVTFAVL